MVWVQHIDAMMRKVHQSPHFLRGLWKSWHVIKYCKNIDKYMVESRLVALWPVLEIKMLKHKGGCGKWSLALYPFIIYFVEYNLQNV